VLKAGKALNERKAEIRVQLRATPHFVFNGEPESMRNEVWQAVLHSRAVVLVQPTTLAAHSSHVCCGIEYAFRRSLTMLAATSLMLSERPATSLPGIPLHCALQLVVRLQPDEAIYLKMIVKKPGATHTRHRHRHTPC
jgi:glucose-6-phosphate 1-dehydrogenase